MYGKTIVHCSVVHPTSSRANSLPIFVLQEAFGASKGLWRFRMSLGVPDFRNPVSSLEMNHGIRLAVDTTMSSCQHCYILCVSFKLHTGLRKLRYA